MRKEDVGHSSPVSPRHDPSNGSSDSTTPMNEKSVASDKTEKEGKQCTHMTEQSEKLLECDGEEDVTKTEDHEKELTAYHSKIPDASTEQNSNSLSAVNISDDLSLIATTHSHTSTSKF